MKPKTRGLTGITEAEIDAAVNAPGKSNLMVRAPAPHKARFNIDASMMTNEHGFRAASSVPGASGDVRTLMRVHTADPIAAAKNAASNSGTGNTISIIQGAKQNRRMLPDGTWVSSSTATQAQWDASHIPIHR